MLQITKKRKEKEAKKKKKAAVVPSSLQDSAALPSLAFYRSSLKRDMTKVFKVNQTKKRRINNEFKLQQERCQLDSKNIFPMLTNP